MGAYYGATAGGATPTGGASSPSIEELQRRYAEAREVEARARTVFAAVAKVERALAPEDWRGIYPLVLRLQAEMNAAMEASAQARAALAAAHAGGGLLMAAGSPSVFELRHELDEALKREHQALARVTTFREVLNVAGPALDGRGRRAGHDSHSLMLHLEQEWFDAATARLKVQAHLAIKEQREPAK